MLSQRLLGNLEEGWLQPTLAALFQDWWYLIVLSVLVSTVLLWMAGQLIKTDMELRRAVRAMAQGGGREEAVQNIAYFRTRRRAIIRPILLLALVLFFAAYPVLKSWYGLE
jgi:hypothetical protein